MSDTQTSSPAPQSNKPWIDATIPETARSLFVRVLCAFRDHHIPCLIAGGIATNIYSGFGRPTHDLDLMILPGDRNRAVQVLHTYQLTDLYQEKPYDVKWIYRGTTGGNIVDLIWQPPNEPAGSGFTIDWFHRGVATTFLGEPVQLVSPADLCYLKMFVFAPKRQDWHDIINIIRGTRGQLDWEHWIAQAGEYVNAIKAIVNMYDMIAPHDNVVPESAKQRLAETQLLPSVESSQKFFGQPWLTELGAGVVPLEE